MKQKSHSGLKKRLKIRKSGSIRFDKAGKKHLLSDKSKRAKHSFPDGVKVHIGKMPHVRRLLPGKVRLQGRKNVKKHEGKRKEQVSV